MLVKNVLKKEYSLRGSTRSDCDLKE